MSIVFSFLLACSDKTSDTSAEDTGTSNTHDQDANIECARFGEEECLSLEECTPIMAAPISYDEENTCWLQEDMVFTECMSTDMSCGQSITHARPDPDASCMRFESMCIPIEWDICDEQEFLACDE